MNIESKFKRIQSDPENDVGNSRIIFPRVALVFEGVSVCHLHKSLISRVVAQWVVTFTNHKGSDSRRLEIRLRWFVSYWLPTSPATAGMFYQSCCNRSFQDKFSTSPQSGLHN